METSSYRGNPAFVDTRGAADLCGIAVMTLHNYRWNKRGPEYVTEGRYVFYSVETVRQWDNSRVKRTRRARN